MANQAKPDVNTIWGSAGLATAISKAKQALGFVAEIPEYDQFNGMIQQISQFQQHVNQEGVALWDALTTYGVGSVVKSPVDRSLYRALAADLLNVAPIAVAGGAVNTNWIKLAHTDAEIQGLIGLYGVTPTDLRAQKHTYFPTTGTATAQVLTPTPAVTAYTAYQRFNVNFNVASGANPTINISGLGAKSLKQYDSTGAKVAAVFAAGQISDVEYDGTDVVILNPLPVNSLVDPWALQPIGVPIGLFTDIALDSVPPSNKSYRYISLSAGDGYNAGVLTGETVTGTGPLLEATAVINLSGSPLNGKTVRLINTERRVLRAGLSGTVQGDQLQGFVFASPDNQPLAYHNSGTSVPATGTNAGRESAFRTPDGSVWRAAIAADDGTNGVPRVGIETRSKNIGVTIFLRIK